MSKRWEMEGWEAYSSEREVRVAGMSFESGDMWRTAETGPNGCTGK